jgi:pyrimidine deaminase RibD-like protein
MNLQELDSFKMADAITFHDELNPKLWNNNHLRPEVREQLILIAEDFLSELGIQNVDVDDITVSGSNAAYSYTPHSDLDLHLLVDMSRYDNDIYKEFFNAKKALYNEAHNIKIHGVPVEVYVQDSREPVVSLGEYSVLQNKWLKFPTKRRANFDQTTTQSKYNTLKELIELALKSTDLKKVNKILGKIKQYRQAGLDKGGEFGPENLAYKALRSQGLITKLYDLRDKLHSEILTIETMYQNPEEMVEEEEKSELPPKVYHVTPASNLDSIMKAGLRPQVGARSSQIPGEQSAIYCFPDKTSLEDAMMNWLGDEFDEDEELALLEIDTTNLTGEYTPNAEFEIRITSLIPPNRIKVLSSNLVTITEASEKKIENEIHNYSKLDRILKKLCEMVVKGQQSDKDYGMVAACVVDPDNNLVAGLNRPGKDGKRIHAERVAIEKYEQKYGDIPEGSIVVTTLSPCNESDDETANDRVGESCTDYLNSKGIQKVYCGYMDPTQDNDNRQFNLIETANKDIRNECKSFADTFLKEYDANPSPREKIPAVSPYAGIKDNVFRGSIAETFNQPYPFRWEQSEHGDWDALAKLADGTNLSIMFNNEGDDEWQVEFYRNNSQEVSGEGDAQRVFATVLTAIQQFIKKEHPWRLTFSASKDNWAKQKQNSESRASLYTKLVQRYARAWGYDEYDEDHGDLVTYELTRLKEPVSEASGYIPSEKEKNDPRFKTALTVDVKPDSIKKNAKAFNMYTSRAGIPPTARPNGKF